MTEETDAPTWSMIAVAYPTAVQWYVQKHGPLPDGPITKEAWETFRAACAEETP